tara:strand:+ start:145 stop:663 length:519 start_codon:yes stop_codon:yes gene_type:complete
MSAEEKTNQWGNGEWVNEPDRIEFLLEGTWIPCLVLRNITGGNLCGYIAVDDTNLAYGVHYDDDLLYDVNVHGGLTFSSMQDESGAYWFQEESLAHYNETHKWFLGFDCAHCDDFAPALAALMRGNTSVYRDTTYRNVDYVGRQIVDLADQIVKLSKEGCSKSGNFDWLEAE